MPDRRSPTPAERNAALIQDAAQQAVALALAGSETSQAKAIARALRDERVDRDLSDHQRRLEAINGSQERTELALGQLRSGQASLIESSKRHAAVAEALAEQARERAGARLSRRALILTALGVLASYLAVLIPLIYLLTQR